MRPMVGHHPDRHEDQERTRHPGLECLADPAVGNLADPLRDGAHEGPNRDIGGPERSERESLPDQTQEESRADTRFR